MSELETPRLLLTPYQETDFDLFYQLQLREAVMRYVRPPEPDKAAVGERISIAENHGCHWPGLGIRIVRRKEDRQAIGHCIIRHAGYDTSRDLEIGYILAEAFWGQGYATEIIGALVRYAFTERKAPRVAAFIHPENQGSRRALEKNGFVFAGVVNEYEEEDWLYILDTLT